MLVRTNSCSIVPYELLKFPGGELHVTVEAGHVDEDHTKFLVIEARITNAEQIMELVLLVDALNRKCDLPQHLVLPYIPYARQDRVANPGEALSIAVFARLINSLNFESVTVWDAHSDVALALIHRVRNIGATEWVRRVVGPSKNYVLVAPDAGSLKKVRKIASLTGLEMVVGDKMRDPKTGEITGSQVYTADHIGSRNFLIVDDICDGGRTFTDLAKELKPLTDGHVLLYVTHGIFSKGLYVFNGLIDQIYCPNVWPGVKEQTPDKPILSRL